VRNPWIMLSVALAASGGAAAQSGQQPIQTLLLTGENNHNWRYTSRVHEDTLEATGRFEVDIGDDPSSALSDPRALARYNLLVLDYNGKPWSEAARAGFARAVESGAGVVVIHAANNAFAPGTEGNWPEYQQIVGLCWIGGRTGHGKFHPFDVRYTTDHPITRGLAPMRDHPDELYHLLANPQNVSLEVLATAFSDTQTGGTGQDEPVAIALTHGKGRTFHTPLGHVWENQPETKHSIADPQFKALLCRGAEWAATGTVTLPAEWVDARAHNRLTAEEQRAGWKNLFDGRDTSAWRGFKQEGFPGEGWEVEDGALRHVAGKGGGDIVTRDQYTDFEFSCQWKIAPKGNSGIMYRSTEEGGATWSTGPEMQVLDNEGHRDGLDPRTSAGAIYGLVAPSHDVIRPAGEWNTFTIAVRGNRVEHWANGFKIAECELNSPAWDRLISGTKFEPMQGFGRAPRGHIALQDHGDDVWFRNLKIRDLSAPTTAPARR
jgi:type 1 glutamine amidotransferase